MIVSVQFDLRNEIDAELFSLVTTRKGCVQADKTVDSPAVYQTAKDHDPLEFPLKSEIPAPSVADIQVRYKKCQDKDANGAKDLMKGVLSLYGAKAVKDLDGDQRSVLMADLDGFLGG